MDLKSYYDKACSYDECMHMLGEHLELHQLHYNKCKLTEDDKNALSDLKQLKVLVVTEPWCGDSLAVFPVVRKVAEVNNWECRMLKRDDNLDLIDQFLTRGGRAVPIFLFLHEDNSLAFKYGPRPKDAQDIFEAHRAAINDGRIEKMEVVKKIRTFYAKNRGKAVIHELLAHLKEI
jgi:thiol-disulfide isomerase/thioredoxin